MRAAAAHLQELCAWLDEQSLFGYLSSFAPLLGPKLCTLARFDEAEQLARRGRELAEEPDLASQVLWRQVEALVQAHRGEHDEGIGLAREAVAIVEQTDSLNFQGSALSDLAEVLHAAGRDEEAAAALAGALDRYERKGNIPMARNVRARLAIPPGPAAV